MIRDKDEPDQPESHQITPIAPKPQKLSRSPKPQIVRKVEAVEPSQQVNSNLINYAQQVEQVFSDADADMAGSIQAYAEHRADQITDAIAEAPRIFYSRLAENIGSLEVDRETFRQSNQDFKQRLAESLPGFGSLT
jgi:hypothetical protein